MMLAKCCKFLNYLSNSWLDFVMCDVIGGGREEESVMVEFNYA